MFDSEDLSGKLRDSDTEYELIRAIGAGDTAAFEKLVRRYRNPVLNFVYRYLGDRFGAEDIAQEVFLRVYRQASGFEPRGRVSSWIFRIAYNLSLNELARRRKLCLASELEDESALAAPARDHDESRELVEEAARCIALLPEKQRAALLLRVNEELSYREIGNVLSVSVSSVESLIFRARENLRKMLKKRLE